MARWKNSLQTNEEILRVKRQAVLNESARIFSRRGYHNTSLDDVAKALNVAKGTLYNYVKDKQEILYECHLAAQAIGEEAFRYSDELGGSGLDRLRNILTRYIANLIDEFGPCGILREINALRPEDRVKIIATRDEHEGRFLEMVETGMRDGSIRQVDAKIAVYTFMGAVHSIALWYSPEGRLSNTEIAEMMCDIFTGGLAAR